MELKIIGVKGLGVVWETEIDERCNEDNYCEFDIWWVTNFKLNNGNCVFRRKIESWEGEEGNEEVEEEYDYFYIVNDVLDSKFNFFDRDWETQLPLFSLKFVTHKISN